MTRKRTTIEYWQTADEAWKATEPAADHDLIGRGSTPREAVANYAMAVEEAYSDGQEVASDD